MSIHETTHRMTPKEQEIFNIGYAKGKADAVKHGYWIKHKDGSVTCSACGRRLNGYVFGYPHSACCGARMDAEPQKEDKA